MEAGKGQPRRGMGGRGRDLSGSEPPNRGRIVGVSANVLDKVGPQDAWEEDNWSLARRMKARLP